MLILRNFIKCNRNTLQTLPLVNVLNCHKRQLRGGAARKQNGAEAAGPHVAHSKVKTADDIRDSISTLEAKYTTELLKSARISPAVDDTGARDSQLPGTEVKGENRCAVPTFNLSAYVNKSPTLQQFIRLGVDLSRIERRKGLAEFTLKLDFAENVQPYLLFLHDHGVPAEAYGELITKNPLLFKVDLDDLQTRVNYLEAKKFNEQQIARILTMNPYWLMFSTRRIDRRLGHFQQEFKLSGHDVRFLAAKQPRLITYNMEHIRESTFSVKEEMGFDADEMKCLLLNKPRLWMLKSSDLIERFAYAHKDMGLPHSMILEFPEVLVSREFRLRQRHEFLKMLGRAQYDPQKDLYISPKALVEGNDFNFAKNIAKSDIKTYELFLKTR